jgi:hypothetical protein
MLLLQDVASIWQGTVTIVAPSPVFPFFFLTLGHNNLTLLDIIHYSTLLNTTQRYLTLHDFMGIIPITQHYSKMVASGHQSTLYCHMTLASFM